MQVQQEREGGEKVRRHELVRRRDEKQNDRPDDKERFPLIQVSRIVSLRIAGSEEKDDENHDSDDIVGEAKL